MRPKIYFLSLLTAPTLLLLGTLGWFIFYPLAGGPFFYIFSPPALSSSLICSLASKLVSMVEEPAPTTPVGVDSSDHDSDFIGNDPPPTRLTSIDLIPNVRPNFRHCRSSYSAILSLAAMTAHYPTQRFIIQKIGFGFIYLFSSTSVQGKLGAFWLASTYPRS